MKTSSRSARLTGDGARPIARAPGRPGNEGSSSTRDAILDAAEALMLDEGYAAVTSRRVAAKAGIDAALVYYYFGTMDDLCIELFRRNAQRRAERLKGALSSRQPLWALWDALRDQSNTALMTEFIALANHRKAVKAVMVENSRRFRRMQLEPLSRVLQGYGVDSHMWPPAAIIVVLSSISRHLRTDEQFGVEVGHEETIAVIERQIRALEGPRAEIDDREGKATPRGRGDREDGESPRPRARNRSARGRSRVPRVV
jgi:AcrR family transcriptional regulator